MSVFGSFILVIGILAVPASAGKRWGRRHWDWCGSSTISDGPTGAAVEVRIGNLPPSTAEHPVYLSWWAARKSVNEYNPLQDPSSAEVYTSGRTAYAENGDPAFNGGKVRVTEAGEATVKVHAPATYKSWRGHGARDPHVHFSICDQHGRPQKIVFKAGGVEIKGGCRRWGSSGTKSYTVISAKVLDTNAKEARGGAAPVPEPMEPKELQEKDMDALEFSPVYGCLEEARLFDQFSSSCTAQCPAEADLVHGQCVRKQDEQGEQAALMASWRLHLDCNDKCWADAVPVSHHMVRLALADHLDIAFQEVSTVQIRKDLGSPTTHAHLKVEVQTRRLGVAQGSSLLASFLSNASMASDLVGLPVYEVAKTCQGRRRINTQSTMPHLRQRLNNRQRQLEMARVRPLQVLMCPRVFRCQ